MGHTYHQIRCHVVFATHRRRPLIGAELQGPLYRYLRGIVTQVGASLLEVGGMPDHVHLLVGIKPTLTVAELIKKVKGASSRWVDQRAGASTFAWQPGYAVFSVSDSRVAAVRRYIRRQELHHAERSFGAELRWLLESHGLETPPSRPAGTRQR